jgi:CRP-like cAMP-binding protein
VNAEALFEVAGRWGPLSPQARDEWRALLFERTFRAGEWLLRAGEEAHQSHFIVRGLVRELYVGEGGEERTRVFAAEHEFTGSLLDLISGEPSITWIQALEDTDTLAFRYRDFERLCERHPDLQRCAWRNAQALYVRKARREWEMLALTAQERHARWRGDHARLDARIQRRHLASYLGITPEHLSRLRRRAASR